MEAIGEGQFGLVRKAIKISSGNDVAVKIIKKHSMDEVE